jgi:hypothetical protein
VNISTVAGSSVGSSATDAGVDTAVSFTPVVVRSTKGPSAMVIIAGTSELLISILWRSPNDEGRSTDN